MVVVVVVVVITLFRIIKSVVKGKAPVSHPGEQEYRTGEKQTSKNKTWNMHL